MNVYAYLPHVEVEKKENGSANIVDKISPEKISASGSKHEVKAVKSLMASNGVMNAGRKLDVKRKRYSRLL